MNLQRALAILLILALTVTLPVSCRNPDLSQERLPSYLRTLALRVFLEMWEKGAVEHGAFWGRPTYRGALLVVRVTAGYFAIVSFGAQGTQGCLFLQDQATGKWSFRRCGWLQGTGGTSDSAPPLPPEGLWMVHATEIGLWGVLGDRSVTRAVITGVTGAAAQVPGAVSQVENGVFFLPASLSVTQDFSADICFMGDSGAVLGAGTYAVGPYGPGHGHYQETVVPLFGSSGSRRLEGEDPAFSPSQGWLSYAVNGERGGTLCVVGQGGGPPEETQFDHPVHLPAWSPDGNYIALVEAGAGGQETDGGRFGRALVIDRTAKREIDLGTRVSLPDGGDEPDVFRWSPDSGHLLINGTSVSLWRASDSSLSTVAAPGAGWSWGAFSPDGGTVAVVEQDGARRAITVCDLKTGRKRVVYSGQAPDTAPSPEPLAWIGESSIIFVAGDGPAEALVRVELSTGKARHLVSPVAAAWLSPDGGRVAFAAEDGGNIALLDLGAGSMTDLGVPGDVVWAPDGSALLIWDAKHASIYRLESLEGRVSTALQRPIVTEARFVSRPVWYDSSRSVALTQRGGGACTVVHLSVY